LVRLDSAGDGFSDCALIKFIGGRFSLEAMPVIIDAPRSNSGDPNGNFLAGEARFLEATYAAYACCTSGSDMSGQTDCAKSFINALVG